MDNKEEPIATFYDENGNVEMNAFALSEDDLDISVSLGKEELDSNEALENLQYADGKERDDIDRIEGQEKLLGVDKISPFGTNNPKVFKRKLQSLSAVEKAKLAERTATRIFADTELQEQALVKAFHEWRSSNWGLCWRQNCREG